MRICSTSYCYLFVFKQLFLFNSSSSGHYTYATFIQPFYTKWLADDFRSPGAKKAEWLKLLPVRVCLLLLVICRASLAGRVLPLTPSLLPRYAAAGAGGDCALSPSGPVAGAEHHQQLHPAVQGGHQGYERPDQDRRHLPAGQRVSDD